MIGALSPYPVLAVVLVLIVAGGIFWLCRDAMRSGSTFEGEVGNRMLSMKIRTIPPPPADTSAQDVRIEDQPQRQ